MRKLLLSMIAVVVCLTAISQQVQVIPLSVEQNRLELKSVAPESFSAKVQIKELKLESLSSENGDFSVLNVDGFVRPSNVGQPNLPVLSKLIEVPYGADVQILIKGYTEEVINLNEYGISRIEPTQPSYHKSTPIEDQVFVIGEDFYNADEYDTDELIKVDISGEMRGVRIGRIEIRPYHYNPVENTLIVYNNLDFEVVFVNADLALTTEMKSKYYTPEFEGSYETILNYQAPATKDAFSNYAAPIKYVIVANTAFQTTLQPFVQWKTKQGYNVIEYYVASGTTNTTIKTYLQNLYTAGTASDPAPLYVLIIGDHSGTYSIPGFTSTVSGNSHVTDLYFATYGGASDYLPDLYYGRISAESTTELSNALNKILPYEQYTLPDFDYLNSCLLVAGTDASWAHKAGDATILYATNNYFNVAHGFSNIYAYYYNYPSGPYWVMSSNSTAADADVNAKIAGGVGFGNYTAHCDHDGWSDPAVRRTNIANWNNINEYPFLIGNCCLSFEYNQSDAFGEMLLYAANEGAVGYIGTTNFSYWYEDVYWGIGLTTEATVDAANITAYNYSNTGLGVYDGIFHENGEAYSNWYYTARQIVHKGNLAVESSSETSLKKYYWEIYHCVGDPSLMPYMTEPDALSLSFSNPMQGATSLTVTTEPYTYVAISKSNVLLDAEWSGSGTSVTLTVPAFTGETYCVVGTKQDRSPYINESIVPVAANPPVAAFSGTPTTILEGQSVTFTDASQYPASWAWNFGDSQTSTVQNPVHSYTTAGTYTVSLTVTNGMGSDVETKTNYITVNPNTNPPTADFVANVTTVAIGGTVNFTDLSINNPSSWAWTFDGGTPASSTSQNPSVVYNTPGTYQVSLTATNAYGSDVETKLAYITVTLPDYCAAASNSTAYERITNFTCNTINNTSVATAYSDFTAISTDMLIGNSYAFTVTLTGGYATDQVLIWCDWNRDGDFIDADENEFTSATGVGPFSGNITVPAGATEGPVRARIRLHDTNTSYTPNATPCGNSGYGEVEDYTFNLTSPAIPPTASFTASGPDFCAGEVTFTDASTLADSWSWNFGDGNTSTEQNPIHNYTVSGTYTVALTVTNAYGTDTDTQIDIITVDIPVAPTTTGASACGPASLTLGASGAATLNWYDAATDGNLVETGSSYITPMLSSTTTYYVEDYIAGSTSNVGPAVGGASRNTAAVLYFDVFEPMILVSVQARAGTAGTKTINLLDNLGNIIETASVNVNTTNTTVTLNWTIQPGTGYRLQTVVNSALFRLNAGVSYPYTVAGLVSITGCDQGATQYYSWFNWTVESLGCSSPRTPVTATINTLPTVNLGSDQTVCGGTVTLDAGAGHSSYAWNGTPGTQTYNASTTGTYTVVVSNAQGCTSSDAANVTINALPTAVSVAGGGTQCGGSMTLTATNGSSGTIYWQGTTSGGTSTATASASQTVSASGTYYFRARSAVGCWGPEGSATVTINPLPSDVTVSGGGTFCGGTATLTATGGTGGTIYWQNTTNNGTSTATASASQTVSSSGTYYFRAQSAQGCWGNQGSTVVTINALPTAVSVAGGGTQCGGSMTLTATNGGSGTIYWQGTTSGGTSTATASASQTVSASGTYYFRARSSEGCWGPEGSATVTINPLPSDVTISGGGGFCGGTATLTATGGTGGTIYWQNTTNNGTSTATASASQTVSTSGTYYFRAQSAQGCWGNQGSAVVTINPIVDITLNSTDESVPGANDGTATVTINSGTPAYDYTWNVAGSTASLTGLTGGSYCVTVSDANGCEDFACVTVNTNGAPPVADFEADVTLGCDNMTVNFTDLSSNNPNTWAWDFGDGNTSTLQNPTNVYDAPGTYTVVLVATNINGSDTETIVDMIIVGETPSLVMSMTQETQTPGMDGTATVVVSGGLAPYAYEWTGGYTTDEIAGLEANTYCVTVTESNGCTVSDCIIVTQEDPLTPPVAELYADETIGCGTLTVQFSDISSNNPTSWAWEFGDGSTSVEQNPLHVYTTAGLFTVTLTATNDDGSDEVEMTDMIFVGLPPVVTVDVVQASGELVADGSAEVVIVGGTAPYDILWSNDETTTTISDLLPGNYSVMIVDAAGCIVTEPFTVSWTNSIDNSTISMSIFPNPASDYVTVEMEGAIAQKISVTNALGQIVIEFNPSSTTSIIDFAGVEPGVYFVNITADGKEFNNKIVVRK